MGGLIWIIKPTYYVPMLHPDEPRWRLSLGSRVTSNEEKREAKEEEEEVGG